MKCPLCEGTGKGLWIIDGIQDKCQMCNGNGTITQTNEEWLRNASTEELAEELDRISMNETSVENWLWWLKEKH